MKTPAEPRLQCHSCKRKRPESQVGRCGAKVGGSYRRAARRTTVNLCVDCAVDMLKVYGGPGYSRAGRYSKDGVRRIANLARVAPAVRATLDEMQEHRRVVQAHREAIPVEDAAIADCRERLRADVYAGALCVSSYFALFGRKLTPEGGCRCPVCTIEAEHAKQAG